MLSELFYFVIVNIILSLKFTEDVRNAMSGTMGIVLTSQLKKPKRLNIGSVAFAWVRLLDLMLYLTDILIDLCNV